MTFPLQLLQCGGRSGERHRPIVFKSNSIGDLSYFASKLKDRDITVSITFDDGFDFSDKSDFKVYMQLEPPEVMDYVHATEFPQVKQTTFEQLIENRGFYDLILAWHPYILDNCENAILFPQALCTWIDPCYLPFCKHLMAQ